MVRLKNLGEGERRGKDAWDFRVLLVAMGLLGQPAQFPKNQSRKSIIKHPDQGSVKVRIVRRGDA